MAVRPRLFVHIGTHKTGSTALQNALGDHAAAFRKEGIFYLPQPRARIDLMRSREVDPRLVESIRTELNTAIMDRRVRSGARFVWSFEGFSGESRIGYENARVVAESMRAITADADVRVIVYLRRQDQFIESLYTQRIHEGQSYDFQTFLHGLPPCSFDWEALLGHYSDCFGRERIIARRYDRAFLPDDDSLFRDFASIIGSGLLPTIARGAAPNRGYSRDALEIVRLVNPHLDHEQGVRLRKILQRTSAKRPFESYSFWSDEQRREVLERYAPSNAAVAREYFDEPSGVLFPVNGARRGRPAYQGLQLEGAVTVLVKALVARPDDDDGPRPGLVRKAAGRALRRAPRLKRTLQHVVQFLISMT